MENTTHYMSMYIEGPLTMRVYFTKKEIHYMRNYNRRYYSYVRIYFKKLKRPPKGNYNEKDLLTLHPSLVLITMWILIIIYNFFF